MSKFKEAADKKPLIVEYKKRYPKSPVSLIAKMHDVSSSLVWETLNEQGLNTPQKHSREKVAPPSGQLIARDALNKIDPYAEAEKRLVSVYKLNRLPPRLTYRSGVRYLDGSPVMSLTQLVRAVNEERARAGESQLDANPAWVIPA